MTRPGRTPGPLGPRPCGLSPRSGWQDNLEDERQTVTTPAAVAARPNIALGARAEKARWLKRLTLICVVGALVGLFSANPLLTAGGLMVPPLLFFLLWRMGEPPVLMFAAAFQWIQVFTPILRADARGESLGADGALWELRLAAWLGLGAITALACGMWLGRGDRPIATATQLRALVRELSPNRLLAAYFTSLVLPFLGAALSEAVPGLRQAILGLGLVRWMVAFVVLMAATHETRFRRVASILLIVEIVLGFGGFFSTFKTILFLATIVLLGSDVRKARLLRPAILGVLSLVLVLTTFWQAIKSDYRAFLNQGSRSQAVVVTPRERLGFLVDKAFGLSLDEMYAGLDRGIDRIGYIDFFALCIQQVPEYLPYQHGRLWKEALLHVVTPRLLFPSKGAISDSARTREFSGTNVAGEEEGTTISLGYVAESYIDFGPVGMFVPVFLVGAFWGWAYRWLATRSANRLLGLSAATTLILMGALLFEASNIKLLGGALTNLVVLSILLIAWSRGLWRLLVGR